MITTAFLWNGLRLSALLATIVATVSAAEVEDADPPPRDDVKGLHDFLSAKMAAEVTRGFRFLVVDQDGHPVSQVPIHISAERISATYAVDKRFYKEEAFEAISDDKGVVVVRPVTLYQLNTWIVDRGLEGIVNTEQQTGNQFVYSVQAPDDQAPVDRRAPGIDYIFHVVRTQEAKPLARWVFDLEHPGDGSHLAWDIFREDFSGRHSYGPVAEWTGPSDLEVAVWRDPKAEGPRNAPPWGLPAAHWWIEITCRRGGIIEAADVRHVEAPEGGYRHTLRWEFDPGQPTYKDNADLSLYWRRTGAPVRYGYLTVQVEWEPHPFHYSVRGVGYLDTVGERVLERSGGGKETPWITPLTAAQRVAWTAEPVDAGAVPLADDHPADP